MAIAYGNYNPVGDDLQDVNEFLIENGLTALFIVSFLAATVLPLGSEWLLVALLANDVNVGQAVAVATVGNFLGACFTYWLGLCGASFLIEKFLRIDKETAESARRTYHRFGSWSLLFGWLPIVGDPLCLIGGILRIRFSLFSTLVFAGKFLVINFENS